MTSLGYAWEQFKSKKPEDEGAGETVWFEPRRAIHLWLGRAELNRQQKSK